MRIPWHSPDDLDAEQRRLYRAITGGTRRDSPFEIVAEDGRLYGPFNFMLLNPTVGMIAQELGSTLRFSSSIPATIREATILLVAQVERSEYEWNAHAGIAQSAGLTPDDLAAIRTGTTTASLVDATDGTIEALRQLVATNSLTDASYEELVSTVAESGVMELIFIVAYYRALASGMHIFGAASQKTDGGDQE